MEQKPDQVGINQKPGMVTAIAIMTLVSGVINILWGFGIGITLILGVFTIFCLPIIIFPIVLGILEIIYAAKLLPDPPNPVQPAYYLAIMEICGILFGNVLSMIVGILAIVFYNDNKVRAYFAVINEEQRAITPVDTAQPQ